MSFFYRALFSVTLLALGIVTIIGIVVVPTVANMRLLSGSIDAEQTRIAKTVSGAFGLHHTASDVQKVKDVLPKFMEFFIKPGREIELFTLLEEKSQASKLTERLRLGESVVANHALSALPLEIELRGPLPNTLHFMNQLETIPLLLPFESVEFRLSPTLEKEKEELISTLRGTAYVHQ